MEYNFVENKIQLYFLLNFLNLKSLNYKRESTIFCLYKNKITFLNKVNKHKIKIIIKLRGFTPAFNLTASRMKKLKKRKA